MQKFYLASFQINIISKSLFIVFWMLSFHSIGQDLEPRLLSAMPINGNILVASYSHSGGNILLDPSLPVEDLDANLNNMVVAYVRSFRLFNKLAKIDAVIPYSLGKYTAIVDGVDTKDNRNGFADPLFRLSLLLLGTKPLKPQDYFTQTPDKFKLGINFRIKVPIGAYNSDYALNVGTNRWSFQSGLGASYTFIKKIIIEAHANTWLFTKNTNFFNGNTTQQKPLFGLQVHLAYVFKPGFWAAISTGKTFGGKLEINDVLQDIPQNNSRFGAAAAYKLGKHSGIKLAYTSGFSTRAGADFNTLIFGYNYIWFDKLKAKKNPNN